MPSQVLLIDDQFTIWLLSLPLKEPVKKRPRDLKSVASAAEAVKGLRGAAMNFANYKTVRSALDCLPRCGWEGK